MSLRCKQQEVSEDKRAMVLKLLWLKQLQVCVKTPLFRHENRTMYCLCSGELPTSHSLAFDPNFNNTSPHGSH